MLNRNTIRYCTCVDKRSINNVYDVVLVYRCDQWLSVENLGGIGHTPGVSEHQGVSTHYGWIRSRMA